MPSMRASAATGWRMPFFAFATLISLVNVIPNANAAFAMSVQGAVTVTEDVAPVRVSYPDGRIVDVLRRGDELKINSVSGDGRGKWIRVNYERNKRRIEGYVDARLTSF